MNKELEEVWTTIYHYNDELIHDMGSEYVENPLKEELDIVNNALLRLKEIDNANPSEALKCLEKISNSYTFQDKTIGFCYEEELDSIKQYILKSQENEKLLQVIKQEFKLELYAMCKRRLELSTNANRDNLEKILEWLKKEE